MALLGQLAANPQFVPALIALIVAGTAFLRAETARRDAGYALMRMGGPRRARRATTPPASPQDRRKT